MSRSDYTEYIARISYGKDSLKMLDVIIQGVRQLRNLWKNYPDLWALLMKWDLDSPVTFKADGHTVHDFDQRFRMEEEGSIDIRRPFRWEMLDNPTKFRCMNFEEISLFGGNYGK